MISDVVLKTKQTLEERGLPVGSYFEVEFVDGSVITEKECNWSMISKAEVLNHFGIKLVLYICLFPVKTIRTYLNGLMAEIKDVPEDCWVYQFMRSEKLLARDASRTNLFGRGIGLAKGDTCIEEKFINAVENRVEGVRL